MSYRINLTKSAIKELSGLPSKTRDKIIEHLRQLEQEPRIFGAEKIGKISSSDWKSLTFV